MDRCILTGCASAALAVCNLAVPLPGQESISLRSGNGSPAGPDAGVTCLIWQEDGDIPGTAFTPQLFADADAAPPATLAPVLANGWTLALPSDPLAAWISTEPDALNGNTGLYAVPFDLPSNVLWATLKVTFAVDNQLGYGNEAGIWVNGHAIAGSQLLCICESSYAEEHLLGPFDISSLVHPGSNSFYLYCMDSGGPAGIIFSATVTYQEAGEWADIGSSLPGSNGHPILMGSGTLLKGNPLALNLSGAKPFASAWLVLGTSQLAAPFKGGVMVPDPNLLFPLFTDFFGASSFGGLWPPGVPSGFTTYFQWWIQDPAGPKGFAASNALAGTTP